METFLIVVVCLLWVAVALLLGALLGLRANIRDHRRDVREVCGDLVDGQAKLKARATQIELQLGRTMRAAGVPGKDA